MNRFYLLTIFILSCNSLFGQSTEDYAVEIMANVLTTPPTITLSWKPISGDTSYIIYKKAKTDVSWGTPIATLSSTVSSYADTSVIVDSAYEYKVVGMSASWTSFGYIFAGIKNPPIHNKGTLLLMVDSTFIDSCAAGITTLMNDLSGDGWQIVRHDLSRWLPDTLVKAIIVNDYSTYSSVNSLLLLGHIAVPYSANFDTFVYPPDGHVPYHQGAWPADIYYGCLAGPWTDITALDTLGSYTANWNIPGDGKWDQDWINTPSLLQVSRVDFYDMPSFGTTEIQKMNSYLLRDHTYKMDSLNISHRALISDNFGAFGGEAFAANGWRNFSPLVGWDSVQAIPLIASLADSSFQWAYGCGGGWFTSSSGIGSTSDFAANPVNGIFMMLFGSFFGDWNVTDNFLRAPLCASTPALTNCWAGRPNWFFHHMALGENIGYSAELSQNNSGYLYQPGGYGNQFIHVALMGDLSLRADYINPVSNLTIIAPPDSGAYLTWTASPDTTVLGYYVYRADSLYGYYQRVSSLLPTTSFYDSMGTNGLKFYMVRPEKLQTSPSGGYYNLGVGVTDSATVSYHPLSVQQQAVTINFNVSIYPNPAKTNLNISINTDTATNATLYVLNENGQKFYIVNKQLKPGENNYLLNVSNLVPGSYELILNTGGNIISRKWVKL